MELHKYCETFKSAIEHYTLTEDQLYFTDTPKEAIALAAEDPDRHPILAIKDGLLVTFFVLHSNEGVKPYSNNEQAILVRTFSTCFYHLGKGYGTEALSALPQYLKTNYSGINEIILAVNYRNEVAQGLYKKCGFIDTGLRSMGKKGELIVMSHRFD
ncbi:GNAT family N-acetyltransferase [Sporosarcina soli]|uniref:GNAT family N-acetyltransferase n=1 Tax=Sporosarcina soli TaxID=334736 RepID=A0ABW0TDD5_9BACL